MAILDYSTKIAAEQTVREIQTKLVKAGVRAVRVDYQNGQPVALAFRIETASGERGFRLPANADGVYAALQGERISQRLKTRQQAQRVSWRIVKDWLEAQLALIEARMASLDEVMLPYLLMGDQSLYELMEARGFLLPAAGETSRE